ncbi:Mothers against decapentaplegic-like 1 [Fragariocoptes setiger]|uniref:Mothers against decapentaplegic homolog n=1 Tax=Fragariocoptes setiger TaxID=1670756 RepID=A0ABQ7SAZ0_9ACAR|nr:Mothers against decapentaplegic-like 1 [Fragariocoptes setiger]
MRLLSKTKQERNSSARKKQVYLSLLFYVCLNNTIKMFHSPIVQRLLYWKQGDEDDNWRKRAIDIISKKIKSEKGEEMYNTLKVAINNQSDMSPCVTIKRPADGRLQVLHRKMLPYVINCRVWRWPDLQNHHELKSVAHCKFPGHQKLKEVCVNPYHYMRVVHHGLPPVVTPATPEAIQPPDSPPAPQSPNSYMNGYYSPQAAMSPQSFHSASSFGPYGNAPSPTQSFESQTPPPAYSDRDNGQSQMDTDQPVDTHTSTLPQQMPRGPSDNASRWCRITYWELSTRVGEPFTASSCVVTVDGFTDPSNHNNRFSLGTLSNINRNKSIEDTRKHIHKGVRLETTGSEIIAECLSDASIFVQSRNCNIANNFHTLAVVKMPPRCRLTIFNRSLFLDMLNQAMSSPENRYEKVFSLNNQCSIRMSFVKGWGSAYARQDVTSTPCWIDIQLLEPLAIIDRNLRGIGSPQSGITSTS